MRRNIKDVADRELSRKQIRKRETCFFLAAEVDKLLAVLVALKRQNNKHEDNFQEQLLEKLLNTSAN